MRQWEIRLILSAAAVLVIPACGDGGPDAGGHAVLDYRVVDARYSRTLDALVTVSADPHRLHVYDPVSRAETTIGLPLAPACVALAPDGLRAAVGHDGWISLVRLSPPTLLKTVVASMDVGDLALAGDGHAYAFPRSGPTGPIREVDLRSGRESPAHAGVIAPGERGGLTPGGAELYVARRVSPSLEKYRLSGGRADLIRSAPARTGPSGGALWFSEDGGRIFTGRAAVLSAGGSADEDMLVLGTLPGMARVQSLAHSARAGTVIALPAATSGNEDSEVRIYDDAAYRLRHRFVLPYLPAQGGPGPMLGRHVFFNRAGDRYFVLARAAARPGLERDWIVFAYDPAEVGETVPPPSGVEACAHGAEVRLRWNAVPGATAYNVYRAAVPGVTAANYRARPGGDLHAGVKTPSLAVFLTPGLKYHFVVTALSGGRESVESVEASIIPRAGVEPPRAPGGIAVLPGESEAAVKWDPTRGATSYTVYVGSGPEVGRRNYAWKITGALSPQTVIGLESGRPYYFAVTASNAAGESPESARPAAFAVEPGPSIRPLRHRVIDAEFSEPLGKIVMVSAANRLIVLDPESGAERGVALPLPPRCLSVGPGGRDAVVGHNGSISYVDLTQATVRKLFPVGTDVGDVVLAGNGFAYAFPRVGLGPGVRCVSLVDGLDGWSPMAPAPPGTRARLHPGGEALFGVSPSAVPPDVERYAISAGAATILHDSPYRGEYPVGGNLWLIGRGGRIVTSRGTVFRTSDDPAEDLLYGGTLPGVAAVEALDHSEAAGRVAVIPAPGPGSPPGQDTRLWLFEDEHLGRLESRALPRFAAGTKRVPAKGRFVFFSRNGNRCFVVVQAQPGAAVRNDFGLVTYPVR